MKFLVLTWEIYPLFVGGMGRVVREIVKELYKRGNKVYVALPGNPGFFFEYCPEIEDILKKKTKNWGYTPYTIFINGKSINISYVDLEKRIKEYRDFVIEVAKKIDFDIIYAHDWVTFEAGIALKKLTGKPLVIHIHATSYDRSGGNIYERNIDYKIEKKALSEADIVFTVSKRERNILIEKYGADPKKIHVIYNGFSGRISRKIANISLKKKYRIVTFVGRLTLQKGVDWFLKAAKIVLDVRDDVLFLVVGQGDMYYDLIKLAADLGISRNVIFTGRVSDEELEQIYSISDVVVFPSVSEPFGLVPLEAISFETPVIISKQSGVAEVINGLKADFWDTEEFANKILALLEYSTLREYLLNKLKEDLRKLSWEDSVNKIIQYIQLTISNRS